MSLFLWMASNWLLFELEISEVVGAVGQAQDELATGARPTFLRLPDIDVLPTARIISQALVGGRRLFDRGERGRIVAGDRLGIRVAGGQDGQALVATQAEFDRNTAPAIDCVERGQVVHRLEEAAEGVG